jgi:heat-inducible transcriptional repressor
MAKTVPDRAAYILGRLVREFIDSGEPVGSEVLVHRCGLDVSSATVRTTLAQLETMGSLRQPHTSAGRVPTDRGYRFYVNGLLKEPPQPRTEAAVETELRRTAGSPPVVDDVITTVPSLLSRASRHAAFALTSVNELVQLRQIEFMSLSGTKILVVVGTMGGQVTQKVIDIGEALDPHELHQAANYLNTEFGGLTVMQMRAAVVERLRQERTLYDALFARALRLAQSALDAPFGEPMLLVEGASTLLDDPAGLDSASLSTLRALFRMVEEKQRLVRILNEYLDGLSLAVVIGAEHSSADLRPFSVVAATYNDGQTSGAIGVIGPTRMRYSRAIPLVQSAARAISRLLQEATD